MYLLLLGIEKIQFKPGAGPEETLVFKHYNAKEVAVLLFIKKIMVVNCRKDNQLK